MATSGTPPVTPPSKDVIDRLRARHEELLKQLLEADDDDERLLIASQLGDLATELKDKLDEAAQAISDANTKATDAIARANANNLSTTNTGGTIVTPFKVTPTTGRTLASRLFVGKVVTTRDEREALSAKHKKLFAETFKIGLPTTQGYQYIRIHEIIKTDKSDNSILAAVDILAKNKALYDKFAATESTDIFTIYLFGSGGLSNPIAKLDLFTEWLDPRLTPKSIKESCDAFTTNTDSTSILEDLMWSKYTILNSIEDNDLRIQVDSHLMNHQEIDQTGPMTFYYLMKTIANCDEETLDKLSTALTYLKLSQFPNEDVGLHSTHWKKMIAFLKLYNKVPVNAKTKLLEQYDRCSVTAFRGHFRTLQSVNHPSLQKIDSILEEGTDRFSQLQALGKWSTTSKKAAVFATKNEETPETPSTPKANNGKAAQDDKSNKTDKETKTTPNPTKKNERPTHDRQGRPIDYTPPKKGEQHTRVNSLSGQEEHWCGTCPRWGNHLTENHAKWREQMKERFKNRPKQDKETSNNTSSTNTASNTMTLQVARPQGNFAQVVNSGLGF